MKIIWLLCILFITVQAQTTKEFIKKNAIEIQQIENLPQQIYEKIKPCKVVIVGEVHGTNESPQFTLGLLKLIAQNNERVALGLEIGEESQSVVDRFCESGDVSLLKSCYPFAFKVEHQDGRGSAAIASLISKTSALKDVRIVCFDPTILRVEDMKKRDEGMAKNITRAFVEHKLDKIVLLAGNWHTNLQNDDDEVGYAPMAYNLYNLPQRIFSKQDILSIATRYHNAKHWGIIGDKSGINSGGGFTTVYTNHYKKYFVCEEHNQDYNATFFCYEMTPSLPLNYMEKNKSSQK